MSTKTKTQIAPTKEAAIGWMQGAKERFNSVQQYLNRYYGISKDKWYELRFEYMCRVAESIAPDYHLIISNQSFIDAFHFQWLKHDVMLHDEKPEGDYIKLKQELLCSKEFKQFIFSYVTIHEK